MQKDFKLTDLHFTILVSSLAPTFFKWLYSFASNVQCTFCSWKTWSPCLGWVQQALSLLVICISFESWFQGPECINRHTDLSLQGWDTLTQGQHSCSTIVQPWPRVLRKNMCERWEEEPVGLVAWVLHLSSGHVFGPYLSHVAAVLVSGNILPWLRS